MAQWLSWGDGSDGSPNAISGTVNTYAACTGTAGQTVLTTALAASDGDQVLIHQTQHATAAGTWEIVKVSSDGGATLNLYTALVNSYSTGAQAVLIPQYTGGDISGTVTGASWDGTVGGIIALMSNGDLTVSGTISINGNSVSSPAAANSGTPAGGVGGGFRGGSSDEVNNDGIATCKQGEGTIGSASAVHTANGNGGGGGVYNGNPYWATGGGGGNGAAGSDGGGALPGSDTVAHGGLEAGAADLTTMVLGGGGGGSAYEPASTGGGGGSGGGIVFIIAKNLTVTGTIATNGGAGATASAGGSGGAGGSVLIKCGTGVLGTSRITATAGTGASTNGANGAVGRIRCDYFTSVTGTTSPTLSSAQDTSLFVPSSNFFAFF